MVNWKGMPPATPEELAHMARVKLLPCCFCIDEKQTSPTEIHHLKSGQKRMGHFFVLPACRDLHHANIHRYKAFERAKWEALNKQLGIEREWPSSKVLPRRVP